MGLESLDFDNEERNWSWLDLGLNQTMPMLRSPELLCTTTCSSFKFLGVLFCTQRNRHAHMHAPRQIVVNTP